MWRNEHEISKTLDPDNSRPHAAVCGTWMQLDRSFGFQTGNHVSHRPTHSNNSVANGDTYS
jgi:hypothetical protein